MKDKEFFSELGWYSYNDLVQRVIELEALLEEKNK